MTTLNIILAVCLILLSAAAALLTVRAMKKQTEADIQLSELSERHQQLDREEVALQKRYNDLHLKEAMLKEQARRQNEWTEKREHISASFFVLDSDENKPTMNAIGKSLSSKIGYALRKKYPNIRQTHDSYKGGRTVYRIDFNVAPFYDVEE